MIQVEHGNSLEVLRRFPDNHFHSIVTDPPYGLSFMGKKWDYDVPSVDIWRECLRVLKPGGHLLAFAGTRTQHRMAVNIEDAGFEIRDMIAWVYGSGFPKSMDVSKAIDKSFGAERKPTGRVKAGHDGFANRNNLSSVQSLKGTLGGEGGFARPWMDDPEKVEAYHMETEPATDAAKQWDGWGTALKPAMEPITVARKPLIGTVAANVLEHGTGGINVNDCRIPTKDTYFYPNGPGGKSHHYSSDKRSEEVRPNPVESNPLGRWPANLIHDGSEEVLELFPNNNPSCKSPSTAKPESKFRPGQGNYQPQGPIYANDSGTSAARFFYCAKTSKKERGDGNNHPTVKPQKLMEYLIKLSTPPGGIILDPFAGSGSTGLAAKELGFDCVLVEMELDYVKIIEKRLAQ